MTTYSGLNISTTVSVTASDVATNNTVVAGGKLIVGSGAKTTSTTIQSGGSEDVFGVDTSATVASGGVIVVDAGGEANAFTVSSGGTLSGISGGLIGDVYVFSNGKVTYPGVHGEVLAGGKLVMNGGYNYGGNQIYGTEIVSGGRQDYYDALYSGARMEVYSGAAGSASVTSGGVMEIYSGGAGAVEDFSGGDVIVHSGGVVRGLDIAGAEIDIQAGGALGASYISAGSLLRLEGATSGSDVDILSGSTVVETGANLSAGQTLTVAPNVTTPQRPGNLLGLAWTDVPTNGVTSATDTTVGSGAELLVSSGGYVSGVTLSGGSLVVQSGGIANSGVVFAAGVDSLEIDAAPGAFGATLSSVKPGDSVDLRGLTYISAPPPVFSGGTLTVSGGNGSESLTLANPVARIFSAQADGSGGTLLTLSAAAPPTLSASAPLTSQTTTSEAPVTPFAAMTVSDLNDGGVDVDTLTIAVSGAVLGALAFTSPPAGVTLTGSGANYTLTGTAAQITAALPSFAYTPAGAGPNSAVTTSFTLTDVSAATPTASNALDASVTDSDAAVAPTITGVTTTPQTTTSEAPIQPFSGVTIGDANDGGTDTDTLTITFAAAQGALSGTGLRGSNGSYTLMGTAAAITGELDALSFTPVDGVPNTSVTTSFTLSDKSSAYGAATVDGATSVTDSDAAVAPTITGVTATPQATTSEAPIQPFSGVTIGDANAGASETLTIALSGADGTLSGAGAQTNGVYTLTGTAAQVTAALRALSFTPTAGQPNTTSTTTFTISDTSSAFATPTVNSQTQVVDTDPAVAPTISGVTSLTTTTGEAPVNPFAGVTIADRNSGATETLTISLSGSGGTLSGANAPTNGVYTLTGTAAQVTAALRALSFTPTPGQPNTTSTTTFTLSDASNAFATPTVNSQTKVLDTDLAVAPTLTGVTTAVQTTVSETPVAPFSGVTVNDPNSGATETLTIGLAGSGGTLSGAQTPTNGVYTLTGTAAQVTTALDALLFTPTGGAPDTASTTTFTISETSSAFGIATVDSQTRVSDVDPSVAPTLAATSPLVGQKTPAEAPLAPFASVTVTDLNRGGTDIDTLTITLLSALPLGALSLSVNFPSVTLSGSGSSYTLAGTASAITTALKSLVYTPIDAVPNTVVTTTFALSDASPASPTASNALIADVTDTSASVAPTIAGVTATVQTTTSEAPVNPFGGVVIGDANGGASETLTISISGAGGTLTGAGTPTNGVYTLTGTAAQVTAALRAISFTPTAGQPNTTSTSAFTLFDKSSAYAIPTVNATTTVSDTDPSVAPTILGVTPGVQATMLEAPIDPFGSVTIGDANSGATEILTITISGVGGSLTGAGTPTNGVYTLTGTAAQVTATLRAVAFTPTAGTPNTMSDTGFTLSDTSSAYATPIVDAATKVADENPAVAPLLSAASTLTGQTTASESPIDPFKTVTVVDANNGGGLTDTLTITLSGAALGALALEAPVAGVTLSGSGSSYLVQGTASAITRALAVLGYVPVNAVPDAAATTDFTIVDVSAAGPASSAKLRASVTDTSAAVAPALSASATLTGQATTSEAPIDLFKSVTIVDPNAGSPVDTITITQGGAGALSGSGLVSGQSGVYTLTGTPAALDADLSGLVFTPSVGVAGTSVTTTFSVSATSSADAGATSNTLSASVVDTDPAVAPTISGVNTAVQSTTSEAPISPFAGVMIGDANDGGTDTDTLTIVLTGSGGTLADGKGFSALQGGGGSYALTGTAAAITAELDALVFTPTAGSLGSTNNTVFGLSVVSSAFSGGATSDGSTQVSNVDPGGVGDVHMVTFDGLHYDFQANGTYTLARSTASADEFDVQIQTSAIWASHAVSLTTAVAAQLGGDTITFDAGAPNPIAVDGIADTTLSAADPVQTFAAGTLVEVNANTYRVDWTSGQSLTVSDQGGYLDTGVSLGAANGPGSVQGLLGSDSGQANDFQLADGTVLAQPSAQAILDAFATSWSVDAGHSLFASDATPAPEIELAGGESIALGGVATNAVRFDDESGSVLTLLTPQEFSGTIAGLDGSDAIDLASFASATTTISSILGTGAEGTTTDVTLTDGGHATTLKLMNQYAGEFSASTAAYAILGAGAANHGTLFQLAAHA